MAPGSPMKSAPTLLTLAHMCSALQFPVATACRGATAATLARTNSPLRLASIPPEGMVEKTRPPAAGRVAMAWQGMDTSSACGAPDTSGAVTSVTSPSGPSA